MNDQIWMQKALKMAELAETLDEVPVGALLVCDNEIIAETHNLKESNQDPLGHAELLAIKSASAVKNTWRLSDCTLYVTLEPCLMCVGAIAHARIGRLVYGARDPKAGAIESVYKIFEEKKLNHTPQEIIGGVLEQECSLLLKNFFKKLRFSPLSSRQEVGN